MKRRSQISGYKFQSWVNVFPASHVVLYHAPTHLVWCQTWKNYQSFNTCFRHIIVCSPCQRSLHHDPGAGSKNIHSFSNIHSVFHYGNAPPHMPNRRSSNDTKSDQWCVMCWNPTPVIMHAPNHSASLLMSNCKKLPFADLQPIPSEQPFNCSQEKP